MHGSKSAKRPHSSVAHAGDERTQPHGLYCARCRSRVTTEESAVEPGGRHRHTFTNPAGESFEIGCFGGAPGCRVTGEPTFESSWFAAHAWSYALCGNCDEQLGWCFEGPSRFFGLILGRLLRERDF